MTKSDWKKCKLGDVCYPVSETYDFSNREKVVFINTGDISFGKFLKKEYEPVVSLPGQAKKSIQKNDILFSEIRPANGRFALVDFDAQDFVVSTKLMVLRAQPIIDLKFLYLLLTNKYTLAEFQHIAESRSGTFPQITFDAISYFPIDLPPLEEQKRIAGILGSLDDKIELLQKQNKTLEDMAKAIFKSWFVDFDVVHAKANLEKRRRSPTETLGDDTLLTKADIMREYHLTDELYDLFPSDFENSSLGPIPLGWQVGKLANIAHVLGGFAFKSKDFTASGIPVIKIKNIQSNHSVDLEDVQYVDENISRKTEKFILSDGDIVMAMTGATIGKFAILVNKKGKSSLLNQRVAKISAREDSCHWFVYLALLLNDIEEQVKNNGLGSAQPNISAEGIGNSRIIEPNSFLRKEYALYVKSYMDKILYNKKQIQTLTELRDTLLPSLISGKIRV